MAYGYDARDGLLTQVVLINNYIIYFHHHTKIVKMKVNMKIC